MPRKLRRNPKITPALWRAARVMVDAEDRLISCVERMAARQVKFNRTRLESLVTMLRKAAEAFVSLKITRRS